MPYNEVPSRRMAYDEDGTVVLTANGNRTGGGWPGTGALPTEEWVALSAADAVKINDESVATKIGNSGVSNYPWWMLGFVFPEKRELDGWYQNVVEDTTTWEKYSLDTTNCWDGTWSTANVTATETNVLDHYRNNISSLAIPGVKGLYCLSGQDQAIRLSGYKRVHLYGRISPGQTPDRIIFLDTENADSEFTKVLDFGDKPRGGTTTRTFKIKNNSSTKTINTIQVTAEDLYLNAGDWYTFGDDGVNYQATFTVGNLGPGATKLLYLKQIIPDAETLGVQAGRIKVSHDSVT